MQGAVANVITDHILSAQKYGYMVLMPDTPSLITSRYNGSCKWSRSFTKSSCLILKSTLSVAKMTNQPFHQITIQMNNHPPNRISLHRSSYQIFEPLSDYETIRLADLIDLRNNRSIDPSITQANTRPTDRLTEPIDWTKNRLTHWIIYRSTDRLTYRQTDSPATYYPRNWWIDLPNNRSSDCLMNNRWIERSTNQLQDQNMNQIITQTLC
jgi:hypothetical protein